MAPSLTLGYERALSDAQASSTATLYGYSVSQTSAYDSRNLFKARLALTATQGAATFKAGLNAIRGDEAGAGFDARLSLGYVF